MREVVANGLTASNKDRAGLSNEESVRFFGPPPLIAGEDRVQYEAMRDRISAAVGPLNFLEEMWVNDVAILFWETQRWRRLRAALLQAAARECIYKLFFTSAGLLLARRELGVTRACRRGRGGRRSRRRRLDEGRSNGASARSENRRGRAHRSRGRRRRSASKRRLARDLQASRDSRGSAASGGRGSGCRIQGNPAQLTEGEAGRDERP